MTKVQNGSFDDCSSRDADVEAERWGGWGAWIAQASGLEVGATYVR